jgi:Undecaprenyl-phosphate galactose phosphotransferase WbaP
VLTFVLGDVVGVLSVMGTMYLGASWGAPARAQGIYEALPLVMGVVLGAFALGGMYQRRFTHPALEMQRVGVLVAMLGGTAALTVFVALGDGALALLVAGGGLVGAAVLPFCRALFRILFARSSWWGVPAVVVGSGGSGATILDTLDRWPEIGVRPVALLSDTAVSGGEGPAVQGGYELAPHLANTFQIPYAIIAMPELRHQGRAKLLSQYSKFFDHVFVVADPAGAPALWTTGQSGDGLFGYGVRHVSLRHGARLIKRIGDLLGGLLALGLLAPVMAVVAVLIRLDSSGAVLYRQERMGQDGRIFTVLKFRTMYADAHDQLARILENDPERRREYERFHKLQDDPRITRVGAMLRRYSLDELPQLFNVLRGDMSLVGPRAYMPTELPQMNGLAQAVLQSPPGITGLWQVSGRNHLSFADRVNLDVHYIQNWSPWLDLYLLVRTVPVVFTGDGAA